MPRRPDHAGMTTLPLLTLLPAALLIFTMTQSATAQDDFDHDDEAPFAIAIHGGAGTIRREDMTAEREVEYRATMEEALRAGHAVLARGGSSLDAVEATIHVLENSPLFNAGRGAVFTSEGRCELDASIMRGDNQDAGAVAGATTIKHPITAARAVMEKTPHVLLAGAGAVDAFAEEAGLEQVDNSYFHTEHRRQALERIQASEKEQGVSLIGIGEGREDINPQGFQKPVTAGDEKFGTVGCVALDKNGMLAAGTSTGGLTNKKFGRVGDSPIIGAGTWAEDDVVAVSCTGQGEYFIRLQVASDVADQIRYAGKSFADAVDGQMDRLAKLDAQGGLVAMDGGGTPRYAFNTPGMYRGHIDSAGKLHIAIYGDEK